MAARVESCQAAASGAGPDGTVRAERQRTDAIVRQAAFGAFRAVGLPMAALVEPCQAAAPGSSPEGAVRVER
jgi:hypothetical protein